MADAEGYVQDATSHVGIPYATMYDYIDGYWAANSYGWWGTPDAYPGMEIRASAPGYNPGSVILRDYQHDPALGEDVLYAVILLSRTPPPSSSSSSSGHSSGC